MGKWCGRINIGAEDRIQRLGSLILKKRIQFNGIWDVLLLKSAVFSEAQLGRYDE